MDNSSKLIRYKIFESYINLFAFTTTKETLGIEKVRFTNKPVNKIKLAQALNINSKNLIFPRQTHTSFVAEIWEVPKKAIEETDALVTNQAELCICIQTADCVPILLFDPIKKIVSAVHAGWRGTVNKIVEVCVQKMVLKYESSPENILATIGPSISPEIYEVGMEVVEAVRKSVPNSEKALQKNNSGKFHFDLWEANRQLMIKCGLQSKNIETLGECSFFNMEKYYSARRDGIQTGRMVTGIMLKP
jgi:YfiH family protein